LNKRYEVTIDNNILKQYISSKLLTMESQCELLEKCGFFKKYQQTKELACRGFINQYCNGPRQNDCKRKEYRFKHGVPPVDDMMPTGQIISAS